MTFRQCASIGEVRVGGKTVAEARCILAAGHDRMTVEPAVVDHGRTIHPQRRIRGSRHVARFEWGEPEGGEA